MPQKIEVDEKELSRAAREFAKKKGTGSFFLDILGAPLLRRPALSEAVGKYREGLTRADVAAGEAAAKATGLKGLFSETRRIPVKTVDGLEVARVEKVKRLTAPLAKSQRFLLPIFAYEGLRRMMGAGKKTETEAAEKSANGEPMMTRDEQAVLLKAADVIEKLGHENERLVEMLAHALHEKQALKIAREMAEKGLIAPDELDKKAQELAQEPDLGVVKKAVDLSQRGFELGKVEKKASVEGMEGGELDPITEYLIGHIHGDSGR